MAAAAEASPQHDHNAGDHEEKGKQGRRQGIRARGNLGPELMPRRGEGDQDKEWPAEEAGAFEEPAPDSKGDEK